MAFTKSQKKSIKKNGGCIFCGWKQSYLDAAHIIDEIEKPSVNGVFMCKNCHAVFDDKFRPLLFKALVAYGIKEKDLPPSWKSGNKTKYHENT